MDVPSTGTTNAAATSAVGRPSEWSSIHAMSLTHYLLQLKAIGHSDNNTDNNNIYQWIQEVLQMAAASMDSLMDCMEALRRAFVDGLVDETSAHGIFLRKTCLGFDQLSFETSAILWSDLQEELRAAVRELQRQQEEEGNPEGVSATVAADHDDTPAERTYWPLSAAQIERALRKECFLVQDIGGASEDTTETTDGPASFEETEVKLRRVLAHDPELPAAHFLRFLNCIKHGERVGALDALHQYFDYAIIQSTASNNNSQDILQFAAILLASLHNSFGDTALAQLATDEAVRVAQQSMDAACVAFALGWIFSNEQSGGGGSETSKSGNMIGGMDMSLNAGDLLKRCAARAMEGHLRPLAAGANLSLTRYYLSGGSVGGDAGGGEHSSGGLAELAWNSVADATSDRPSTESADDGAVDRPTHMADISNSNDVMETLARQQMVSAGIWDYFGMTNLSGISSFLALYCHADTMLSHDVVTAIQNVARVTLYGSSSVLLAQDFSGTVLEEFMIDQEKTSTGASVDVADKGSSKPADCIYSVALSKLTSLWSLFRLPMDGVFLLASTLILHEWAIRRGELHQATAFGKVLESYLNPRLSNYWQVMIDVFSQKSLLLSRQGKWAESKRVINEMIWIAKENDLRTHHAALLLQLSMVYLEANPQLFTGALPSLLECLSMTDKFEMDGLHATALSVLAQVHLRMRNPNRAIALLQAALPSILQREHVWFQGDAYLTLAKCRLQLAKNVDEKDKNQTRTVGSAKKPKLVALLRSAIKDLLRSQIFFQQCQDCTRLREVFYLQARIFDSIPGEQPQRDTASQAFIDVSEHLAAANQPQDAGVADCLSSMTALEKISQREIPIASHS